MVILKMENYKDIKIIKDYSKENMIVVDVENCLVSHRKRIVDFLGGLSYLNCKLTKRNKNQYVIEGGKND